MWDEWLGLGRGGGCRPTGANFGQTSSGSAGATAGSVRPGPGVPVDLPVSWQLDGCPAGSESLECIGSGGAGYSWFCASFNGAMACFLTKT